MKKQWSTIFEDEYVHVIDKSPGLLSIPDRYKPDLPNIQDIFKTKDPGYRMVHRLDKETSGIIILAKSASAHQDLNAQFENRTIRKIYHALVEGVFDREKVVEVYLRSGTGHKQTVSDKDGKWSYSEIRPVEVFNGWTLVEIELKTGRTHQARVHCAHIGNPVVGDALYGTGLPLTIERLKPGARSDSALMDRVALHAARLTFTHPETGELISLESTWPKDFRASINQLRKWSNRNRR